MCLGCTTNPGSDLHSDESGTDYYGGKPGRYSLDSDLGTPTVYSSAYGNGNQETSY